MRGNKGRSNNTMKNKNSKSLNQLNNPKFGGNNLSPLAPLNLLGNNTNVTSGQLTAKMDTLDSNKPETKFAPSNTPLFQNTAHESLAQVES